MQQKTEFSPEDATWEALTLTRIVEPADYPDFYANGEFDSYWYKIPDKITYNSPYGWRYKGGKLCTQISYYNDEGERHRLIGPAIINKAYKIEFWLKDGFFHRENGPAYIQGHKQKWYYEGKLHRLDGPAIIGQDRPKEYWIHGQKWSPKNYKKEIGRRRRKGLL